jgi:hypothetical protein
MGNFSVYLNKKENTKVSNVASSCKVAPGKVLRVILHSFPEDYLKQLVDGYKEELK